MWCKNMNNRFWIAFVDTLNEQIYDDKLKIIIWTKTEKRVEQIKINIADKTWEKI